MARWSCAALLAAFLCPPGHAAPSGAGTRPRIGLALSGGGARGAAHIGVLEVLEEHRVPVDFVAGTSMGALVGGLYASGIPAKDLERVIAAVDWADAFVDAIPRAERSFHRKRDDDLVLVRNKPGLRGGRLLFPPGLIDGQKIDLLLKRHTLPVAGIRVFDDLPIPYRAIAADVVTGEPVVLERGDLALALRASMAIPAAFAPREIDGRLLVDGGIRQNLPIEVVRRMGADIIIAVDIGPVPQGRDQLQSVVAIATQLTSFLSDWNAREQVASLGPKDILIRPDLGGITVASFDRAAEAVPVGARAARAVGGRLEALSLSEDAWREHLARRARRAERLVVDEVRIVNRSRLGDDVIAARFAPLAGAPLDVGRVETSVDRIFGLELFESVYYDLRPEAGRNVLDVTARERSWGPDYVQAGVAAYEDHAGPAFDIAVAYSRTAINRRNGEWRTGLQLGRDPGAFSEWHQPLDRGLRSFVHLRGEAVDLPVNVFDASGRKTAELEAKRIGIEGSAGGELGTWGELRAGLLRESGTLATRVGVVPRPVRGFEGGDAFLQLSVDRLDEVDFPTSGAGLRARWTEGARALGSDMRYAQALVEGSFARSRGRTTGLLHGMLGSTLEGDAPVQGRFGLGGFARLSGLEWDELAGPDAALLGAAVYRRVSAFPLPPIYAGVNLEYGNVFPARTSIRLRDGIASGGAFLGADTFVGPMLLAWALAEGGRSNYYLSLGETFHPRRPGFRRR